MAVYYIHKPTTIISLENFREQKISHKRKNGKKIFLGALSAIAASVAAGTMIKNKISEKNKKEKGLYYTVSLEDLYNSYDDKTLSEEEMINEIKKESSL